MQKLTCSVGCGHGLTILESLKLLKMAFANAQKCTFIVWFNKKTSMDLINLIWWAQADCRIVWLELSNPVQVTGVRERSHSLPGLIGAKIPLRKFDFSSLWNEGYLHLGKDNQNRMGKQRSSNHGASKYLFRYSESSNITIFIQLLELSLAQGAGDLVILFLWICDGLFLDKKDTGSDMLLP